MKNYSTYYVKNNMITILNIETKDDGAYIFIDRELSYFLPNEEEMEDHLIEKGFMSFDDNDNIKLEECDNCFKDLEIIAYDLKNKNKSNNCNVFCYNCFIESCKYKLIKESLIMLTIMNLYKLKKNNEIVSEDLCDILVKITTLKVATVKKAINEFSNKYGLTYNAYNIYNVKKIINNYEKVNEILFSKLKEYEINTMLDLEEFCRQ